MFKLKSWYKKELEATAILLRCIPATTVTLFVVSVICMNLLANKTLLSLPWIARDGGILISWLSFMCMDIITKYFGPKASNKIAILASMINLLTCLIFYIASVIPSNANDYTALDGILGGTWFVLLGSTMAFLVSAVINNLLNWTIGRAFKRNPDGKLAYVNVMKNMSVDCDCCAIAEDPCIADIGILASLDPIAIDQACVDLVYASSDPGRPHLIERIESRNGIHTIEAAAELGFGSREYELIEV